MLSMLPMYYVLLYDYIKLHFVVVLHISGFYFYVFVFFFFFKQKTAYEMRISDWSSDVCSSDLKYSTEEMNGVGGVARPVCCDGRLPVKVTSAVGLPDSGTAATRTAERLLKSSRPTMPTVPSWPMGHP